MRLDVLLTKRLGDKYTRSQITNAIKSGHVTVHEVVTKKCGFEVSETDAIQIAPSWNPNLEPEENRAQDIPLDIVFQDQYLMVINKPRGMVTHPGAGNHDNTLLNALLHHATSHVNTAQDLNRAGIVHRLDKNTAGLLIVARDITTQGLLSAMLERREVKRAYLGIVEGVMQGSGTINKNIVRDPNHRTLFTVTADSKKGRTAITHYTVVQNFAKHTLVRFNLETGRTHQIRVHCKSIGHPLVGDPEYNPKHGEGQMLESVSLSFIHPRTGEKIEFEIQPTQEFKNHLTKLNTAR
ncbi:MAG: RluA family pseudouridine synthase [Christensenellaceae bacterium]|jgi:23S rRNA pseudouridine1911/1915/1917 synthase|nr:RluA family pseudouridine synthase [Christensenellaceae bacterium]